MPHDPADGCAGCDIWPVDPHLDSGAAGERLAPPRGPDDDWEARAKRCGTLHARRPCTRCGQPVRVGVVDRDIRLRVEPLPWPPEQVDPRWPSWWWSDTWGLVDRIRGCDDRHPGEPLFLRHHCPADPWLPDSMQPTPAPPPPPAPQQEEDRMTSPDPFAGGDGVPAVSFKDAPVGTTITMQVTKAPELVQELVYGTKDKAFWPQKPGETGAPQPKMAAVVAGIVNGEERALWASKPSALFAAIKEAQVQAGSQVAPGGTLSVQFTGTEPTTNAAFNDKKLYRAHYAAPNAFGGEAPAAAPAAPAPAAAPFPPAAAPAPPAAAAPWAA